MTLKKPKNICVEIAAGRYYIKPMSEHRSMVKHLCGYCSQ